MRALTWYMSRLRSMSVLEIASRLTGEGSSRLEQLGVGRATPPAPRTQFVPLWIRSPAGIDSSTYVEAAERVIDGSIRLLGENVRIGGPDFDWNCDPLTQVRAPMIFGRALNIHSSQTVGDIKYLWEPNRHLAVVAVASAYERTAIARYRHEAVRLVASWLKQCPYPMGPNWASGLELGIRLINWSLVWQLLDFGRFAKSPAGETHSFRDSWLRSIYQHVHFVRRHYSRHSSANNHLIGEAAGVFIACCSWPFWSDFERWRDEAFAILLEQLLAQSFVDGLSREQTTSYQLFVLQFLLLSMVAGRARGIEFPEPQRHRVNTMLRSLADMRDAGGNLPMIGDGDDGQVIQLSQEDDFCPYRSAFATGALLFDDPELAREADRLDDQTRWLLDTSAWDRLDAAGRQRRRQSRAAFHEAGYFVMGRELATEDEVRLMVDCGPLGYLSIAAHGHADALSIYLSVAGREFLIDPGTYTYHGKPDWRAHFRGTRAHNTLTVDRQDQSVQAGNFMWLRHAKSTCLRHTTGEHEDIFVGEHDGYRRLSDPVIHRRQIRRVGSTFYVEDILTCMSGHEVEQWWQFSEKCRVVVENGVIMATNGSRSICMRLPGDGASVHVHRGSEDPVAGWVSRSYDRKVPATAVCVSRRIHGTARLVTSIECELGLSAP
jgi:hypothetical protein